jgi:hypothetical protein
MTWLPIDTAPKDGTRLLLACTDGPEDVIIGRWQFDSNDPDFGNCWGLGDASDWAESWNRFPGKTPEGAWGITHWMPLPASPLRDQKDST